MMPTPFAAIQSPKSATRRRLRGRSGMTLLEILIVIALIGVVATITIVNLAGQFQGGQTDVAKIFVTSGIRTPLETYRIHMGNYPTTEQGLRALVQAPQGKESRWRGPYLQSGQSPEDPWGQEYQYRYPGTRNALGRASYDVWSMGPDGLNETADDIGNWDADAPAQP